MEVKQKNDQFYLGVPLIAKDEIIGVIVLFKNDIFTKDELRFSSIISSHTALVLANIYSYSEMKKLSIRDGLTGLYNQRFFMQKLSEEINMAKNISIVKIKEIKVFIKLVNRFNPSLIYISKNQYELETKKKRVDRIQLLSSRTFIFN